MVWRGKQTGTAARRIDALDRRLGRAYSRMGGWLFLALGITVLVTAAPHVQDDPLGYWPVPLFAGAFFLLARYCFKSRQRLSDQLDEGPRVEDHGRQP